jgi:hypothetical protein
MVANMEVANEQLARQFLSDGVIGAALEGRLKDHPNRQSLYPWLSTQGPKPFRYLLVRMYGEEIRLRQEIWQGRHRDDLDLGDGIYDCAFLLHCCGDPADSLVIWKTNMLNQDIGELDARFLVGAGIDETIAYLRGIGGATAREITDHINEWIGWGDAATNLREWRDDYRAQLMTSRPCQG